MTIKTKLTLEEFRKLNFTLAYSKPGLILLTLFGILMFLSGFVLYFFTEELEESLFSPLIAGMILTFLFPFSIFVSSTRNFNSDKRLQEEMEYEFTDEKMKVSGESFSFELELSKTHQIIELKNWFLIYQNKISANLIPKRSLSESEIKEMRKIFSQLKGVKLKIKSEL